MNYRDFNGEGALPIVPRKGVGWGLFPSRLNQRHQLPPLLCLPARCAVPPPPHPQYPPLGSLEGVPSPKEKETLCSLYSSHISAWYQPGATVRVVGELPCGPRKLERPACPGLTADLRL